MECNEVFALIDDYFDDVLSDDSRIDIDKHLGNCFRCNAIYNEMTNYFTQLKSFSDLLEKPVSLQREIAEELTGEKTSEEIKPKKKGFNLFKRA